MQANYARLAADALGSARLRRLCVAVVGLGALGSEVCRLLGQIGCGRVLLIDPDHLAPENLPFSVMYRIGLPFVRSAVQQPIRKSEVLAASGDLIFPDTAWVSCSSEIADIGLQILKSAELIFSCTDNVQARAESSFLARLLAKPMIDGGLMAEGIREGRVSWFPPLREQACYLCQLSAGRRAEVLASALASSSGCASATETAMMTGTPTTASVVAAIMTDLGIRFLCDPQLGGADRSSAWRYTMPPGGIWGSQIHLTRASDCPWHTILPGALIEIAPEQPIRDALNRATELRNDGRRSVLELLWPICLQARCRACGAMHTEPTRAALLRTRAICTQCKLRAILDPIDCIQTIHEQDRLAASTTAAIGLETHRLFWCRPELFAEDSQGATGPLQTVPAGSQTGTHERTT